MLKINVPITEEQHAAADAEHVETVREQRTYLLDLAERVINGGELDAMDRAIAAAALRNVATNMSEERPRPTGKPALLPDFELAVEFVRLTQRVGMSKNAAFEKLAEQYDVSETAVKKRLGIGKTKEARARKAQIGAALRALDLKL